MKYVLVDRGDNIVDRVELTSDIGVTGARTFFVGRKQIESEKFDKLWKVMTEREYNKKMKISLRKSSSHPQAEWWKEDKKIIDDELKW